MRSKTGYQQVIIVFLALALTQLACNLGSSASNAGAQPTAISETQAVVQPQDSGVQPTAASGQGATQSTPATSSARGTVDEAKAMLAKAVEHYNTVGRDQGLKDFTARVAPFFDSDLYVVCMNSNEIETANGGFPQYVGTSANQLMDNNGTPLGKAVLAIAATSNEGSVSYHWVNPANGQTEPKTLYFQKLSGDVCGVGVYTP